jgi:parallel beta-helix repeat protein
VSVIEGAAIQPGDTICIQGGARAYLLFRNLVGTAELPITIINAGGQAVIDTDNYYGIKFFGCRHVRLIGNNAPDIKYGFKIKRVGNGAGISVDNLSTNVELAFIEISNTAIGGIYAKTEPDCSFIATRDKFTLYDLRIHDCYLHDIADEGFYIGSSKFTGQTLTDCDTIVLPHIISGVKIYNNLVENTGWDGIQVSSAPVDCEIYNNIIRNDSYRETPYQMSGILIGGGSDCDCYNNTITDGKGDGIDIFGSSEMMIFNNLIVRPGRTYFPGNQAYPRHGIFFGTAPDNSLSSLVLVHNTIIQPKTNGIRFFNNNTTGNLIQNNIICEPGDPNTQGEAAFFNHNLQNSQFTIWNNILAISSATVKFIDSEHQNFDLKPNSPAVNTATQIGDTELLFDILNRDRPFHAGSDIGAFECHDINADITSQPEKYNQLIFAPNPANSSVSFILNNSFIENVEIQIFDSFGRQFQNVKITRNTDNQTMFYMDISTLKNGVYFVHLSSNMQNFSGKLIVK